MAESEVFTVELRAHWLASVIAKSKSSSWSCRRLSDLPSLWQNQRGRHDQIQDFPTQLRHDRIGDVIAVESKNFRLDFERVKLGLQLPHGQIKAVVVNESKTFRLNFVKVESETSFGRIQVFPTLLHKGRIGDLDFLMAESEGSLQPNWRLFDSPLSWWVRDLNYTTHYDQTESILPLRLIIAEWNSRVKYSFSHGSLWGYSSCS